MMSLLMFLLVSNAVANVDTTNFGQSSRQGYLQGSILSFQATSRATIDNMVQFVNSAEQNKCRTSIEAMALPCLKEEIERNCTQGNDNRRKSCAILADIILVNKINEKQFISRQERFRIAKEAQNRTKAYSSTLERKYGLLATELLLFSKLKCKDKDNECLVKEIDRFCLINADVKNISWQACGAALIYFISTSK